MPGTTGEVRQGKEGDDPSSLQANYYDLVQDVAAVIWEADPDRQRYTFVSGHAEVLLGYPASRWLDEPHFWVERIHPDDRARTVLATRRASAEARDHECEYRTITSDGRIIWLRDIVHVVRSRDGRTVMLRGVMTDVTSQKRAEAALTIRARQQAAVAELGQRALAGGSVTALLADTVQLVSAALGDELVTVEELLDDGETLELRASVGLGSERVQGVRTKASDSTQSGYAVTNHQAVIVEDVSNETRFSPTPWLEDRDIQSGISVVIPRRDASFGVLSTYTSRIRVLGSHDLHFLQAVATVLATAIDRKEAADRLLKSERRFNTLATISPVGIFQTDPDGLSCYVNEQWCSLAGLTYEQGLGRGWSQAIHPEDRARIRAAWRRDVRRGTRHEVETRFLRPDGTVLWVLVQAQAELRPDGEITGYVGTVTDITELKRAEEQIKESQRKLSALMADLPGMAYRCRNDPDWTMEFVSEGSVALTGYRPEDLIDSRTVSFAQLIIPEDRDRVWEEVQEAVGAHEPYRLSYRIKSATDAVKWMWEQGRGVFAEDGSLLALEGFIADTTERKRLEEQLLQSHKLEALGRLAGGVAHDFNNLLTAILGFSVLVMNQLGEDHTLWRRVNEIKKAAERAASLTSQLLAFSRSQVLQPKILDLNTVVADMNEMLRRLIGEDVDLSTVRSPALGRVKADRGQLEQVIVNLAINARDSMPQGGKLVIGARNVEVGPTSEEVVEGLPPGPYVILSVEDTGVGMDAETQSHIFEPFFTTKDKSKGTGLGLATVYGIVKQSGGEIRVSSELGRGTRFSVFLPRVEGDVGEPAAGAQPSARGYGTETILLVEDDDVVRELASRVLEMNGYKVLVAARASEALKICKKQAKQIDLVVTDVVMPAMSGGELAQRVLEMRPDIKVLYISGYTDDAIVHLGVLDRSTAFLQKPFTPNTLALKVREVIDGPKR